MSIPFKTKNLQEIFNKLHLMLSKIDNYELDNNLLQIESTYTTMLQYMVKGVNDPNAGKIYLDLVRQCYQIGFRSLRMTHILQHPTDKYVQTFKSTYNGPSFQSILSSLESSSILLSNLKSHPNSRESIQTHNFLDASKMHQSILISMFNNVWTSDAWNSLDYETSQQLIHSETLTDYEKSLFISSVILSLQEMFDEKKLMCLFDAYESTSSETRMRSAVGIALTLRKYDSCINLFTKISSRLSLLLDSKRFIDDMYLIMMQLQYSKITDKISDKMQNDIIPSLLDSGKFKRTDYGIEEIDDYLTQNGENPEWHKGAQDDVAQQKIQEMAELQMEGADVQMSTFIHMKNGAFFQEIGNWFLPFSIDHPDIISLITRMGKENQLTKTFITLLNSAPFCNSDRYSFAFMIDRIGSVGQEMINKNISGQLSNEELKDQLSDMSSVKSKDSDYSRYFIHDLYRFFIAYPFHIQFDNPFASDAPSFTPLGTETLHQLLNDHDHLLSLAEFFMRKELYSDALKLFYAMNPKEIEDHDAIWQKIGFCQQKSGDMEGALSSYTIAYSLNPQSQWTLKHLAQVSYLLHQYAESEIYYDLLLNTEEDNLKYLKRKTDCQIKDSRYADAIPVLYKLNYLDEQSIEVKENLAFCLLMAGQREKSKEQYEQLLLAFPDNPQYHMNLANIYYLEGEMEIAYSLYSTAYNEMVDNDDKEKQFKRMFVDSAKLLKPLGIDIHKFQMMYDAVVIMNKN